jgi:hypothetical protein
MPLGLGNVFSGGLRGGCSAMILFVMADMKIIDESHKISEKRGNGKLRREVWVDSRTRKVTRYNLAYINHNIHPADNGRVLGYDNAHDGHHRHYFGVVEPVEFVSFEDTEARFEQDWIALKDSK